MREIDRALVEGAKRSRAACSNSVMVVPPSRRKMVWQYVWPRYKWVIAGVVMFLLIDILVLSGFGSTTGGW